MKRKLAVFILSAMMAVSALGGCARVETPEHSPITFTEEELSRETKLVVDPSVTGSITVRYHFSIPEDPKCMFNATETVFHEYYPNAEMAYEVADFFAVSDEEYGTKLAAELMAGSGPDVFFHFVDETSNQGSCIDPYKMMKAGAFLDLTDYFRNDKTYNPSDFNQTILQAGQLNGRQYLVPADYAIPLFMTTKKMAEKTGFNPENCRDSISTLEEMISVAQQNPLDYPPQARVYMCATPFNAPLFTGSHWADSRNALVNVDTPEMRKFYELVKENLLPYRIDRSETGIGPGYLYASALTSPSVYFVDMNMACYDGLFSNMQIIEQADDTPICMPWRTFDGKIEAYCHHIIGVNRNTKSPDAAYHFIRTWLSQEYLMKEDAWGTDLEIPINNLAVDMYLQKAKEPANVYYSTGVGEGQIVILEGVSQESIDQFRKMIDEIDYCTLDSPVIFMMRDVMEDYYSGNRSYESCISEVQSKLEIYLTE